METFRAILSLLTPRERLQMGAILAFMLPNALMQVAGVASVMPFIAVLAQPELVESNQTLATLHNWLGAPPVNRFLALLAGGALVLLVLSNALAAFTTWLILRFSFMRVHTLSRRLLEIYLKRSYAFFLIRNPSDLTKNVINEVNQLVNGYLMPMLQLAANTVVVAALLVMLIMVDPVLAVTVGLVLGGAYGLVYLFFRQKIRILGQRRLDANARRFKATHEAFSAIKDLKVMNREDYYLKTYGSASYAFATNQATHQVISQMPRYALEAIAFGTILIIALYLTTADQSMHRALPVIALYAMAGYRLMPALQKIFDNVTRLRFASPVVDRMREEMAMAPAATEERPRQSGAEPDEHFRLRDSLTLRDITFRYPGSATPVLDTINISIKARTTVGFVGESGAGKSTLADIILGLLEPEHGTISVDGRALDPASIPLWQRHIGYVPQSIYLADDTLRRNIALGIPDREIDDEAVERAARAAAIHDFIVRELPKGYATVTGDRGVRLSGGQRQRIGIARALYHNPDLLILDEATSALDGSTEAAVMDAIDHLSGEKTIIMIAHRLTTVRNCDVLHLLKKGRLIASGSHEQLLATQPDFRRMANAPSTERTVSAVATK